MTNVTLIVNRNPVNLDSLEGLTLSTLEAVLTNADAQLGKSDADRQSLTAALQTALASVKSGHRTSVVFEVTSSLDTATKTIKHIIEVR